MKMYNKIKSVPLIVAANVLAAWAAGDDLKVDNIPDTYYDDRRSVWLCGKRGAEPSGYSRNRTQWYYHDNVGHTSSDRR